MVVKAKPGRPAGSSTKGVPKVLRQYIALQKAGFSVDDAERILTILAEVK